MYEEKDYILRLIHEIARFLIRMLFHRDIDHGEPELADEERQRYLHLTAMVDDGRINEAENELTDGLDTRNVNGLLTDLLFYDYLNKKDDDFLREHQFSRTEVHDGVKYLVSLYGYGDFLEAFMEENQ